MKVAILSISVTFDEKKTDAESIANALDNLLETAMGTPGILEEYGDPYVGPFYVERESQELVGEPDPEICKNYVRVWEDEQ